MTEITLKESEPAIIYVPVAPRVESVPSPVTIREAPKPAITQTPSMGALWFAAAVA
jgi:hypothetical protein